MNIGSNACSCVMNIPDSVAIDISDGGAVERVHSWVQLQGRVSH